MLGGAMYTTIKTLMEKGMNKSQIAQATGHDWKTVAKVFGDIKAGKELPEKKPHPKILEPHKEKIVQLMEEGLSGVRIYQELQAMGVKMGYSTVKGYLASIRRRENIFVRIHTAPGEEAQVDFGYVGLTPDNNGKKRKTWVFNMRLSYSRLDYYEKVYDQRVETFIQCHINAFNYFGGVTKYVRIDNLKAAILEANFYEPLYQRMYKSFSEYYRFGSIPCRIYRPNDKGKVESGIKYVKGNFFAGRTFTDGDSLNKQLMNWVENANSRIHGTTRKVPKELFAADEKAKLNSLPQEEFKLAKAGIRKVYHDCHIYCDYNYYSVPFEYVGKEVEVEISKDLLRIYYKGKEIALHKKQEGRGNFSTTQSHYPKYKSYSETEYQEKYQAKMAQQIGEYGEQLFFLIVQKRPNDWTRTISGILSLVKTYSKEVVNLSCKRGIAFEAYQYQIIKTICSNGSYKLPLEFNLNGEEK